MHFPRITEQQTQAVLEIFRPLCPLAIYLFGSFGTAHQHPESDVDLAILTSSPMDPLICFRLAGMLADALKFPVDLVDLRSASTVLAKEVIRTGHLLFIADDLSRQYFEMKTLSDYARLNEERSVILRQAA